MSEKKARKPNVHAEKADFWYENVPGGPAPAGSRNYPRDCAAIARGFFGSQAEWEDYCTRGWNSVDEAVRHYSMARITSFVALIPQLIKVSEPSPEERKANIAAVNAAVEIAVKGVKVNNPPKFEKDTVRGGWKRA